MRRLALRLTLALALLVAVPALVGGCDRVDKWLGCKWSTTVTSPEEGTPEWVVHEAVQAALEEDEAKGWERFRKLLHSSQLDSPASEQNWRTMNFSTFRRKVPLYLEDDNKAVFDICYQEDQADGGRRLFVKNEKSEMPTPCKVMKDPEAGGAWRITMCSL
ncbi:MAG: hypothetical protein ACQEXJ_08790 [Myxococcota bacterium]